MESNNIKVLVEKWDEGKTSLEEELILEEYLTSGEVPAHLREYQTIFYFTAKARTIEFSKNLAPIKKQKNFAWIGIAASIVLVFGIFMAYYDTEHELEYQALGSIEDPEEAYLKARETLQLVSQVLNTGKNELTYVKEFDKARNKYIKE